MTDAVYLVCMHTVSGICLWAMVLVYNSDIHHLTANTVWEENGGAGGTANITFAVGGETGAVCWVGTRGRRRGTGHGLVRVLI